MKILLDMLLFVMVVMVIVMFDNSRVDAKPKAKGNKFDNKMILTKVCQAMLAQALGTGSRVHLPTSLCSNHTLSTSWSNHSS